MQSSYDLFKLRKINGPENMSYHGEHGSKQSKVWNDFTRWAQYWAEIWQLLQSLVSTHLWLLSLKESDFGYLLAGMQSTLKHTTCVVDSICFLVLAMISICLMGLWIWDWTLNAIDRRVVTIGFDSGGGHAVIRANRVCLHKFKQNIILPWYECTSVRPMRFRLDEREKIII